MIWGRQIKYLFLLFHIYSSRTFGEFFLRIFLFPKYQAKFLNGLTTFALIEFAISSYSHLLYIWIETEHDNCFSLIIWGGSKDCRKSSRLLGAYLGAVTADFEHFQCCSWKVWHASILNSLSLSLSPALTVVLQEEPDGLAELVPWSGLDFTKIEHGNPEC